MTQFEDVLETILEEYARRDSEGEFDTWEETDAFVKEKAEVLLAYVKEEPVSEGRDIFDNCLKSEEKFILENTKALKESNGKEYFKWLTPDQARKAVEIAREETLQEVKEKLLIMLNTSIDNKHFFEQLDDYIEELENKQ